MSDRKYYYMRLKEDFFDSDEMILLEAMPDGIIFQNILLKMYCRSLKSEGRLMLNGVIPFNSQMLASVTRQQIGTVEKALDVFQQLGLIEILDNGAIYMSDIQKYIGSSSTEADRKREYRVRIDAEKGKSITNGTNVPTNVRQMSDRDRDITKDRDKDIDNNNARARAEDPVPYKKIMELYHSICKSYPKIRDINGERKKAVSGRYNANPNLDTFKKLFEKAEASKFLQGNNDRNWTADFDFMMNASRFDKILEGVYDDKEPPKTSVQSDASYDIDEIERRCYDKYRNAK